MKAQFLTQKQLESAVPAAFATIPHSKCSDKYNQVTTSEVLKTFKAEGWYPTSARQQRSDDKERTSTNKHMIRLRRKDSKSLTKVDECHTEIVLSNSHNGTSCFRIQAGVFRMACTNGLIVCDGNISQYQVVHFKAHEEQVLEAIEGIIEQAPIVADAIERFSSVTMTEAQILKFAKVAAEIRSPRNSKTEFDLKSLANPYRPEDQDPTLWNVFNVCQEKAIRGGIAASHPRAQGKPPRQFTSRPVENIAAQQRINTSLWEAAEATYSKLAA